MLGLGESRIRALLETKIFEFGAILQRLLVGVKAALLHGLQEIFLWSAVIMTAAVVLHVVLKREPLRARVVRAEAAAVAAH